MGRKYAITNQDGLYFVTFTVVNWIDLFIRDGYKDIFLESVRYCQKEKGLQVHAWVMMTSHIHLVISTSGKCRLQDIVRDLKSYTSRHIRLELEACNYESRKNRMLHIFEWNGKGNPNNRDFQLWIQDNHPILLANEMMLLQRLEYIHNNPVTAGFMVDPTHWKWGSAYDYTTGKTGIIELALLF
jgi:putative transposase